jgi:hypothetical protein
MNITSIEKDRGSGQWFGTAEDGDKTYQWFCLPSSRIRMQEEEPSIPGCWMSVDPSPAARRAILIAVRRVGT